MPARLFIPRLIAKVRYGGLAWLGSVVRYRLLSIKPNIAPALLAVSQNRVGLEIGGPSKIFGKGNILPVYSRAARIDNVNFANATAWESGLCEEGNFNFDHDKPPGRQYLREATHLDGISDSSYDFILSSHCLEHVANPLAALHEWVGYPRWRSLMLILPDPPSTFNHRWPTTTLAHLNEDFARRTSEDDLTHLPEILQLHDLKHHHGRGMAKPAKLPRPR